MGPMSPMGLIGPIRKKDITRSSRPTTSRCATAVIHGRACSDLEAEVRLGRRSEDGLARGLGRPTAGPLGVVPGPLVDERADLSDDMRERFPVAALNTDDEVTDLRLGQEW